jgi:hypothetical protein
MGGECSTDGAKKNACRILVENQKERGQYATTRHRWEDNIKIDLIREIGWGGMDWINMAQERDQWRALENTTP